MTNHTCIWLCLFQKRKKKSQLGVCPVWEKGEESGMAWWEHEEWLKHISQDKGICENQNQDLHVGWGWLIGRHDVTLTDSHTHTRYLLLSGCGAPESWPPTWANHTLLSCTTHAFIWSKPGQGLILSTTDRDRQSKSFKQIKQSKRQVDFPQYCEDKLEEEKKGGG